MNKIRTHCKQCLLQSQIMEVSANSDGLCNYRSYYNIHKEKLEDYVSVKDLFLSRVTRAQKLNCEYHAVVGISGGKDGAYVLHRLKNKYNLNVLAVTLDNEFLSNKAILKAKIQGQTPSNNHKSEQ